MATKSITKSITDVDTAQPQFSFANFFARVQDAPWYDLFLQPAIDELQSIPVGSKVLDVGTGPGKFIALARDRLPHAYVGIDTDEAMLRQARQRPALADVPLIKIEPEQPFLFDDRTFDAVCFCSVLFIVADPYPLLTEALRVLQPGGQVIVLTPTGLGNFKQEWAVLRKLNFSLSNWTFFLWRTMTRTPGQRWAKQNLLLEVAAQNELDYHRQLGFEGFAVVETLQK